MSVEVIGLKAALGKFEPRDGLMITARADAGEMAAEVRVGSGPLVVVSDGLNVDDLKMVASAVTASGRPCIEVRSERWDGESPSPLSAACRGVISGFGVDAARQAAAALESP